MGGMSALKADMIDTRDYGPQGRGEVTRRLAIRPPPS